MLTPAFAPVTRALPGVRLEPEGGGRRSPTRLARRGSSVCPSNARRTLERYNGKVRWAPTPPRRADLASMKPAGKELAVKKIISLALVGMLSLALVAPVSAGRGHGGGFQRVDAPAERGRETARVVPSPAATK